MAHGVGQFDRDNFDRRSGWINKTDEQGARDAGIVRTTA